MVVRLAQRHLSQPLGLRHLDVVLHRGLVARWPA